MTSILHHIAEYHARTKHGSRRYARGPSFLDWDTQPDPFRAFAGARRIALPVRLDAPTPSFGALGETRTPAALTGEGLGLFLELALGLSAWKVAGGSRWALRNNPSSGNLHPTEGWVLLPALDGIGDGPALHHYAPYHHALEERRRLDRLPADLPDGAFLFALSSIPWRESWKYGERAFRYCQHDVGHALAAAAYAAACLGWSLRVLTAPGDEDLAALLGLDRQDSCARFEPEHPDLIAVVSPAPLAEEPRLRPVTGEWAGEANTLSPDHVVWEAIGEALRLSEKPAGSPALPPPSVLTPALPGSEEPAGGIIRRRRSAQAMDGQTGLSLAAFRRILAATLPDQGRVPFSSWPWAPRLDLMLFVHRVEGLEPGLYALIRDAEGPDRLKTQCDPDFVWERADQDVPLYRLNAGDYTWSATELSCLQNIAGRGAFSLGMLADFDRTVDEEGQWAYRRLFWEAGMVGQVLYLEAAAAGVAGTGIGCYHDDEVHDLLGLPAGGGPRQSLYHFTIGGAVEDSRIATAPAYGHLGVGATPAGSPA